jgi:hypothetical protein
LPRDLLSERVDEIGTRSVHLVVGLEHLSRGTARHVDTMLVVTAPYFKSLETARRSFELAPDLEIGALHPGCEQGARAPGRDRHRGLRGPTTRYLP